MSGSRKVVAVDTDAATPLRSDSRPPSRNKRMALRSPGTDSPSGGSKLKRQGTRYKQTAIMTDDDSFNKRVPDRAGLVERMFYVRDNMLEKQWTKYLLLSIVGAIVLVLMACLHMLNSFSDAVLTKDGGDVDIDENMSFGSHLWAAWTYMADPGTHAGTPTNNKLEAALNVVITMVGIFFFATVLGVVVDGISGMLETLKKGKSKVIESDHTVILGWTDRCPALIKEIALACESEGGGTVCVLAEQDRQELEAEKNQYLTKGELRGLNLVFRTGSPMVVNDLNLVSACTARNIIVLAPTGMEADKADSIVLRTVLQLKVLRGDLTGHVVAELRDVDNESLVQMVGMGSVETVVSHDIVGRLMLMAARQPGLASVYESILGFEGDEFYLREWPELRGCKFKDLPLRFPHAVALGLKKAREVEVKLNPDGNHTLETGDELLVLAMDDDSYEPTQAMVDDHVRVGSVPKNVQETPAPEVILMCGWRRDVDDIIKELDNMVVKGSQLHMLSEVPVADRNELLESGGLHIDQLVNITLVQHFGNSAVRRQIEDLPLDEYDSILILADEMRESDMMHSDSHSLASLLLIRDIQKKRLNPVAYQRKKKLAAEQKAMSSQTQNKRGTDKDKDTAKETAKHVKHVPLHEQSRRGSVEALDQVAASLDEVEGCLSVCEILDHRTRHTYKSSRSLCNSSDFVQSNEFVSRVLAMVAERKEMKSVLVNLLGSTGTSLCVNAPVRYVHGDEQLSFYSMALRVQEYNEILCGYKRYGHEPVLNPKNKNEVMRWDDVELIVMANAKKDHNHHDLPHNQTSAAAAATSPIPMSDSLRSSLESGSMGSTSPSNIGGWCKKNALERVQSEMQGLRPEQKQKVLDRVMALMAENAGSKVQ